MPKQPNPPLDEPLDRNGFNMLLDRNKKRHLTSHEQELMRDFLDDGIFDHLGESADKLNGLIDRMNTEKLSEDELHRLQDAAEDPDDWLDENTQKGLPSLEQANKLISMLKTSKSLRKGNRHKLYATAAEDDTDVTIVGHDEHGPIYAVEYVPDEVALGGPLSKEDWYFHMARAKCWEYEHEPSHEPSPPITQLVSEVALHKMIHVIAGDTSAIPGVLHKLAESSDEVQGGYALHLFMWVNDTDRKNYANIPANAFSTVSKFARHKPNNPVVLGVAICWVKSPVGQSVDAFYKANFHVNLILLILSPIQKCPRTIVVCDPNIHNRMASYTCTRQVLFPRICNLLDVAELKNLPRWCNKPREVHNTKGTRLTLALDWAVELVANGVEALGIQCHGGDITHIKGFRKLTK
ncbi:hypothetical protein C8R44DRAFT_869151 [Mycena epipterygia]|nr:hypothetical protein C8R44DRAFT_869151 [Mycena epipterygia]